MNKCEYYRIYAMDWDDNIIKMPTKIVLIHKETQKEKHIPTEDYAKERSNIGISGKFKNYMINNDEESSLFSYRFFRDSKESNHFLKDLNTELKKKNPNYKNSWYSLIRSLSYKETAKHTFIITARGHKPSTIYKAFKILKKNKIIKHLPKMKNIFPVTHFVKKYNDMGEVKSNYISKILDQYMKLANKNDYSGYHHFSFSDDDAGTILKIAEKLGPSVKNGRWSQFQISLHYTGESKKIKKGSYVIGIDGKLMFQKPFPEDRT